MQHILTAYKVRSYVGYFQACYCMLKASLSQRVIHRNRARKAILSDVHLSIQLDVSSQVVICLCTKKDHVGRDALFVFKWVIQF